MKDRNKLSAPKGVTTPQDKQRQAETGKKSKSLKRAGSPALSESSGNESTRKKPKKNSTMATGSRSGTPLPQANALRRSKMAVGSGSDGEATAGEMSDGAGTKKKIRIVASSRGTPAVSRASSPNPAPGCEYIMYNLSPAPANVRNYSPHILYPIRWCNRAMGDPREDTRRGHCYR